MGAVIGQFRILRRRHAFICCPYGVRVVHTVASNLRGWSWHLVRYKKVWRHRVATVLLWVQWVLRVHEEWRVHFVTKPVGYAAAPMLSVWAHSYLQCQL